MCHCPECRNVNDATLAVASNTDLTDLALRETEEHAELALPLIGKSLPVHEHVRRDPVMRDQGAGHDRLSGDLSERTSETIAVSAHDASLWLVVGSA